MVFKGQRAFGKKLSRRPCMMVYKIKLYFLGEEHMQEQVGKQKPKNMLSKLLEKIKESIKESIKA